MWIKIRLLYILLTLGIVLISLVPVIACQKDNVETHAPIPFKDWGISQGSQEAPDDLVITPGGYAYHANVHQQGVKIPGHPLNRMM
jgi:hypothetical protein